MGSHNFEDTYYGTANAQEAYSTLVAEARYEHGADPYSGTIATTGGARVAQSEPVTIEQARKIADERIDNLSKWDACEAIALVEQTPEQWEDTGNEEVTLTVTGKVFNDRAKMVALIAKELGIKAEQVKRYRAATGRHAYRRQADVTPKVDAVATKGKTETRYFIVNPRQSHMPLWEEGHASQA